MFVLVNGNARAALQLCIGTNWGNRFRFNLWADCALSSANTYSKSISSHWQFIFSFILLLTRLLQRILCKSGYFISNFLVKNTTYHHKMIILGLRYFNPQFNSINCSPVQFSILLIPLYPFGKLVSIVIRHIVYFSHKTFRLFFENKTFLRKFISNNNSSRTSSSFIYITSDEFKKLQQRIIWSSLYKY